jgi:hypothetical protein
MHDEDHRKLYIADPCALLPGSAFLRQPFAEKRNRTYLILLRIDSEDNQ